MERISIFERNLRKFAILDNAEGDINAIWQDESSDQFFMESMLEKCSGYIYFKATKEDVLKFMEQEITLEELYEKGMRGEVFIRLFDNQEVMKKFEIKFHGGGLYLRRGFVEPDGTSKYIDDLKKRVQNA